MRKITICLVLSILTIFACSATGRKTIPDGPVAYTVILSGSHSSADKYEVKLVTTKKDWENTWQIAKGGEEPLPGIPSVDFSHQNVIAVFMGQRSSSGYKIEISSIEKKGAVLRVHVKKYETPGMLTVMTNPFTLVRVPRGKYELEVIEETVQ
ncbi:MAG TPA: hypothetical protein DEO84_10560 [candidate division Zixibacteria bacterium]|nr:hypothetical protein [candidate division Zixibacteria bacterium]HBZ01748.1 hypothetical protein [candidate division Zixibacteria bacterium]